MRRGRVYLSVSDSHPVQVQVPQTPACPLDAEPGPDNNEYYEILKVIMNLYMKSDLKIWKHMLYV